MQCENGYLSGLDKVSKCTLTVPGFTQEVSAIVA